MSSTTYETNQKNTIGTILQHLAEWRHGLDRLENEVTTIIKERQSRYAEQISEMRQHLQSLQNDLQALEKADEMGSNVSWAYFHDSLIRFRHRFMETARGMREEDKVPLGWLQGFTDERTHESSGWAEGLGKQPEGSEGWAEGMGRQGDESRGWAEGYQNN